MGIFDFFKRKNVIDEEYEEDEVELVLEKVDFSKLSADDRNRYVEEQCEVIVDCNNNVDAAKREYKTVSSYFADIQIIEEQPEEVKDKITYKARSIVELGVDRKMLFTGEKKLSGTRYQQLSEEEDTIVDSIKNLKNNEIYLQIVKKDMSALSGEKAALKMDKKEYLTKQAILKNITIVSFVCFAIIFVVFFVAAELSEYDYTTYFYWVLLVAALFAVGDILLYRKIVYNILLTDRKMNRAIALHNKVKIKYINSTNLVEYQYAKYGVRNAYELSDLYQRYLETKATREKYRQATLELSDAEEELSEILAGLGLYDYKIWIGQVRALADPKEMVEVRHDYSVRRQTLRKVIEENSTRAEEAKKQLRQIIADYPDYATEILQIVEKYED